MTEEEVARAVREAAGPVRLHGGDTRTARRGGETLDLSAHAGITLYEPGALTLVARAGTPLAEVEEALSAKGQRLAFEPPDLRPLLGTTGEPTIGGVVATNASGPRRMQAGACRDALLGLRFVSGEGEVVKNGGRVMKNVTGYDLAKLLCGSRGTLGAITEAALKVLPAPAATATFVLDGLDPPGAVAAMSAALRSPYEVTGAAHDAGARRTWLRIEGFAESVAYRAGRLAELLAPHGASAPVTDREEGAEIWRRVRDAEALASAPAVWRVCVRPSEAARVASAAGEGAAILMDWGGGLVWVGAPDAARAGAVHRSLRALCAERGGHATQVKGDAPDPLQPEAPAVAALAEGIRRRFDPRGVFA